MDVLRIAGDGAKIGAVVPDPEDLVVLVAAFVLHEEDLVGGGQVAAADGLVEGRDGSQVTTAARRCVQLHRSAQVRVDEHPRSVR